MNRKPLRVRLDQLARHLILTENGRQKKKEVEIANIEKSEVKEMKHGMRNKMIETIQTHYISFYVQINLYKPPDMLYIIITLLLWISDAFKSGGMYSYSSFHQRVPYLFVCLIGWLVGCEFVCEFICFVFFYGLEPRFHHWFIYIARGWGWGLGSAPTPIHLSNIVPLPL